MRNFSKLLIGLILFGQALISLCAYGQSLNDDWSWSFNGQGDFSDRFSSAAAVDDGFILGGSTVNTDQGRDYLLVKIDFEGTILWEKTYNAPGNGHDEIKDVAFQNGQIFITGHGKNRGVGNDFWTMALDMQGDSLWSRLYNDPTFDQYDEAVGLCIDQQGNVFVTGESDSDITSGTNHDYLTVKYDASGTFQWARRYGGAGTDRPVKIVCTSDGNVIVTGRSFNGADDDFVTVAYDQDGTEIWVESVDFGGTDRASDMGIDGQDNVYITGRRDNGNDDDFLTVKYDSNGVLQFSKVVDFVDNDRATAISVSEDGSFVVCGRSDASSTAFTDWDIRVVSYNANGDVIWNNSFDGGSQLTDFPLDIALSSAGEVAVSGYSSTLNGVSENSNFTTLVYSADGLPVITYSHDGTASSQDEALKCLWYENKLISLGFSQNTNSQYDARCVAWTNGLLDYEVEWQGAGDNADNIRQIAVASSNKLYYAGYTVNSQNDRDYHVAAVEGGNLLWSTTTSGSLFGSDDECNTILTDDQGFIYTCGFLKNSGSGSDIWVEKIAPDGTISWSYNYNSPGSESDRAYALAIGDAGDVFVCGRTDIDAGLEANNEVILIKISSTGNEEWVQIYNGQGAGSDRGQHLELAAGGLTLVGRLEGGEGDDILILRYSLDGTLLWDQTFDSGIGSDNANDIFIDDLGNLYVAGQSTTSEFVSAFFVAAFDSTGELLWDYINEGDGNNLNSAETLDKSDPESLIVGGYLNGIDNNLSGGQSTLIRLDATTGDLLFENTIDANVNRDVIKDLKHIDGTQLIVTAGKRDMGTKNDPNTAAHIALFDASLQLVDELIVNQTDTAETALVVELSESGFFVAGNQWIGAEQRNQVIWSFSDPLSIRELNSTGFSVYPNPAKNTIHIRSPSYNDARSIRLFDSVGNVIREWVTTNQIEETMDISELTSGFYVLQLETKNQSESVSLIITK